MIPFIGKALSPISPPIVSWASPSSRRVVEVFARRLRTQQTMTTQIAETIDGR